MKIEIKTAEPITLKYDEKEFIVHRPKVGIVRDLQKKLASSDAQSKLDLMLEFCIQVGVPNEVVNDWDTEQIGSFFTQLSGDEKKT